MPKAQTTFNVIRRVLPVCGLALPTRRPPRLSVFALALPGNWLDARVHQGRISEPMTGNPFTRFSNDDVRSLIEHYPLAWVQARSGDPLDASLLPLVGVYDADGTLVELIGHLARSNPLCAAWAVDPVATVLFRGPQAYVSPQYAERRNWGPTWNYAQLAISCEIRLDDAQTEPSLDVLTDLVEAGRPAPWRKEELAERYPGLLSAIIGFRAPVVELRGKFKLGQDERDDTLRAILRNMPDEEVRDWMTRFNIDRL